MEDPGVVYLGGYPSKRAYILLSLALTTFIDGHPAEARGAAARARRIRLNRAQAEAVRTIMLFDIALVAQERHEYAAAARRFQKRILGNFGAS